MAGAAGKNFLNQNRFSKTANVEESHGGKKPI